MKIKKIIKNKFPRGIFIHAGIIWVALILGYNSYKEYMNDFDPPLSRAVRELIKSTFPQTILIFIALYAIFLIRKKNNHTFLTIRQYIFIFSIYTILMNLFFFSHGKDILIPLNVSISYVVILLPVCWFLNKYVNIANRENFMKLQEWLPPIVYRFLDNNLTALQFHIKESPSASYIMIFMVSLMMCAFLLIAGAEKTAEQFANIAYFSLVIGLGIKVYLSIKDG